MSSESRTLIVLLLLAGLLGSCCLCVPVVALIAVPAVARVQKAAEVVRAKQEAERQALAREMQQARIPIPPRPPMLPPPTIPPTTFPRTRSAPISEPIVEPPTPPIAVLEPPIIVDSPRPAPKQRPSVKKKPAAGLASLSEGQRRAVYRSVTVLEKMEDSMKRQIDEQRKRGFSTAPLERMLKDRQSRQTNEMERILQAFQLSREELDQVLAEGKAKGW
jgi:hypothetical protein